MIITFGEARQLLAQYAGKAGKCPSDTDVSLFVKDVIQQLLFKGANGNVRKWEFYARDGMITLPPDLELPLKVKVGKQVGMVFDKWYEFYDQNTLDDCIPFEQGLVEDPNLHFTAFDIPCGGRRIMAVPFCKEADDAHFVIQGLDKNGREIYVTHQGERHHGEYIGIRKGAPSYSKTEFTKITALQKTETNQHVRLYWYDPSSGNKGLLGEYRPKDVNPSFRRFRVSGLDCSKCYQVSVLGRVRLLEYYYDNDIIPISNIRALKVMAQQIRATDTDKLDSANFKNQLLFQTIEEENHYKRTPQAPIDFDEETSPGNLKTL